MGSDEMLPLLVCQVLHNVLRTASSQHLKEVFHTTQAYTLYREVERQRERDRDSYAHAHACPLPDPSNASWLTALWTAFASHCLPAQVAAFGTITKQLIVLMKHSLKTLKDWRLTFVTVDMILLLEVANAHDILDSLVMPCT